MNGEFFMAMFLVALVLVACGWIIYKTMVGHVPRPEFRTTYNVFDPAPHEVRRRTKGRPKKKPRRRRR